MWKQKYFKKSYYASMIATKYLASAIVWRFASHLILEKKRGGGVTELSWKTRAFLSVTPFGSF
jgi:hypothetical protein